jgi:hypothetical protein
MMAVAARLTGRVLGADDAAVAGLRLEPELVPQPLWGISAHQLLPADADVRRSLDG